MIELCVSTLCVSTIQACGSHRLQLLVADVYVSADECTSAVSLMDITRLSLFLVTQNLNNQKP